MLALAIQCQVAVTVLGRLQCTLVNHIYLSAAADLNFIHMSAVKQPISDAAIGPSRAAWTAMPSTRNHLQPGQIRTTDVHVNICSTFACDTLGQVLPIWARDILGLHASFVWAPYGQGLSVLEAGS